jgi:hypothetical protein
MKEQKKLGLEEMQELFCDYAFNRLAEEDRILFEQNLIDFPELQQELVEVSQVFNKVESVDFDKKISSHTRNLSVKVNEKLSGKSKLSGNSGFIKKYLVPSLGLVIITFIIFSGKLNLTNDNVTENKSKSPNIENFTGLTSAEVKSLFDDESEIIDVASNLSNGLNPKALEQFSFFADVLEESYNTDLNGFVNTDDYSDNRANYLNSSTQYQLFNQLENLDEDEFQKLLEELENADFNS